MPDDPYRSPTTPSSQDPLPPPPPHPFRTLAISFTYLFLFFASILAIVYFSIEFPTRPPRDPVLKTLFGTLLTLFALSMLALHIIALRKLPRIPPRRKRTPK